MRSEVLIVGAGPVGCAAARVLAEQGLRCLVIEKRGHIAGNCYDEIDEAGILIHKYGPHCFRTESDTLMEFLSRFTEWIPAQYNVKSKVGDELYQFPINLETLEQYFKVKLTPDSAMSLLEQLRLKLDREPANSEEFVMSRLGKELFESFYLGYSQKQWGCSPKDLAPSVCGRVPIRLDRNPSFVDGKYQVMPKHGYTKMFTEMLSHPNIEVLLSTDFLARRTEFSHSHACIYTGPIDEYFDNCLGKLPWRSLEFKFKTYSEAFHQECFQINYPDLDVPYTRSVEIKHITQQQASRTSVSYEYPQANGEPYYPVLKPESAKLLAEYQKLVSHEESTKKVYFGGRLAEFTYINSDEALEKGLALGQKIAAAFKERQTATSVLLD